MENIAGDENIFEGKRGRMVKGIIHLLLILPLMTFYLSDASADIYSWTDSTGKMHLSDNPAGVPAAYRHSVKLVKEPKETGAENVIPFERTPSGLILVQAVLNGVKAKMVLDTGADVVVVTTGLSKRLNQDLSSLKDNIIKLHTNCGDVEGHAFVINRIELGGARKENVRSVITPEDAIFRDFDGLLGLSFLGDFKVTVDYKKGQILLER